MAKSIIIKQLANSEVSVSTALNRLLIIASDIGNDELYSWVDQELNGYEENDNLPEYRRINAPYIKYSGINGSFQVTNNPLPIHFFNESTRKHIKTVKIYDSIDNICNIVSQNSNQERARDLTYLAGEIEKNTGIQCFRISQVVSIDAYRDILNKIKTKLLKILIELDKAYGCLDELDIDISSKSETEVKDINNKIVNIIDNSIHIGDGNKIDKSQINRKEG